MTCSSAITQRVPYRNGIMQVVRISVRTYVLLSEQNLCVCAASHLSWQITTDDRRCLSVY